MIRRNAILLLLFGMLNASCARESGDQSWSKPVNGIRARVTTMEAKRINGTPIISTYLELRNVSDVANPLKLKWDSAKIDFSVIDENGKELPRAYTAYDGPIVSVPDLVLPHDSVLKFNISRVGLGILKDKAALIDLGPMNSWIIEKTNGKKYYLKTTIEIQDITKIKNERYWTGKIQIPKAIIPLKKK